ncbi:HPr family phosphocarrier protein [Arthrobacter sp. TmT3-37]
MERSVVVANPRGVHAMLAVRIAAIADSFSGRVFLRLASDPDYSVDASQVTSVLSLGAGTEEVVTITCEGPGAEKTVAALVAVLTDVD